ncbi:TlpA family protein disulfide reductase [Myceligenerans xiligouense]|uniref:Thiol-disulfide isomerase/thioredoxin n=1 Tax=Myceligenerans xiligouense TaxID=253184 RepID=A0A3N4YIT2_9MICO|nr:deiodinase-like protein [Myceligenerans xiligouense]RPF20683.1 thiol-disulfide isomerase/thioredoxin [Myceligenerans xiligouense]
MDPQLASHHAGSEYRFERFRTRLLIDDMTFDRDALGPGSRLPEFDLPLLDGGRFTSGALGERPVLMVFGSRTCPVTESSVPVLKRLHARFGNRVRFVLVNTREAHPGQTIGQPATDAEKHLHAQRLRLHHDIPFEVAVDDIDGTVHRAFSPKPNSAYLVDTTGTITFRFHWANDEPALRRALERAASGNTVRGRSGAMAGPLLRAVGHLPGIVTAAGSRTGDDIWRAAPPLAVLGALSRLFPGLPADRRGPAAAAAAALMVGAVAAGLLAVLT